jgi:polyhydroxyalkanoate synthesis regulator phasin
MMNEFKKLLLAGLGSAAYTYEKASKLIDDMVQKGKLTMDEGKELSEELKRNIKNKVEDVKPLTKDDLVSTLNQMNFATKDDLQNIKQRLDMLEEKVNTKS